MAFSNCEIIAPALNCRSYKSELAGEEALMGRLTMSGSLFVLAAGNCPFSIDHELRPMIHLQYVAPNQGTVLVVTGLSALPIPTAMADDRSFPQDPFPNFVWGDVVNIGAPGQAIIMLGDGAQPMPVGGIPGRSSFAFSDGTSHSAAFVSGAAALVLGTHPEASGQPAMLKSRILQFADQGVVTGSAVPFGRRLDVCTTVAAGPCPPH